MERIFIQILKKSGKIKVCKRKTNNLWSPSNYRLVLTKKIVISWLLKYYSFRFLPNLCLNHFNSNFKIKAPLVWSPPICECWIIVIKNLNESDTNWFVLLLSYLFLYLNRLIFPREKNVKKVFFCVIRNEKNNRSYLFCYFKFRSWVIIIILRY